MEIIQKDLVLAESLLALWMHMGNFPPTSIAYNMCVIAMHIFELFYWNSLNGYRLRVTMKKKMN